MPTARLVVSLLVALIGAWSCAHGQVPAEAGLVEASLTGAELQQVRDLTQISSVSLRVHRSEHFLLFHAGETGWAAQTANLLEQAHSDFHAWLGQFGFAASAHADRLVWVCFCHCQEFDAYSRGNDQMDMSWTDGYYSARTNRVALVLPPRRITGQSEAAEVTAHAEVYPAAGVTGYDPSLDWPADLPADAPRWRTAEQVDTRWITHELAHQLAFNCGLQKRGVLYPLWLAEGLATSFEADDDGRFGFGRDNAPRRRTLLAAHAHHRLLPLRRFVAMDRLGEKGQTAARRQYAQAWGLFHFLSRERPEQLRQYLRSLRGLEEDWRDPATLRREFVEAFGPIDQMERDWRGWLANLAEEQEAQEQPIPAPVASGQP